MGFRESLSSAEALAWHLLQAVQTGILRSIVEDIAAST
jgi:hypothetical protein